MTDPEIERIEQAEWERKLQSPHAGEDSRYLLPLDDKKEKDK